MEKLTIPRSKWKHGGIEGRSYLHNPQTGLDCCLGHLGRLRGVPDKEMAYDGGTEQVYAVIIGGANPHQFCANAIEINDNIEISLEDRESKLIAIFAENGIELNFVD